MKKLAVLAALAISAVTFNPVEANAVNVDNSEINEMSHWTQFRDSITGRNRHENDDRYDRHDSYGYSGRHDDRYDNRRGHRPPPPPPRHRW